MAIDIASMSAPQKAAFAAAVGYVPEEGLAEGVISNAQIKAWNATPHEIVPAPGAGYAVMPQSGIIILRYTAPKFGGKSLPGLYWGTSAGARAGFVGPTWDLMDLESNGVTNWLGQSNGTNPYSTGIALSLIENLPLVFTDTAAATLGNSEILYRVPYLKVAVS